MKYVLARRDHIIPLLKPRRTACSSTSTIGLRQNRHIDLVHAYCTVEDLAGLVFLVFCLGGGREEADGPPVRFDVVFA